MKHRSILLIIAAAMAVCGLSASCEMLFGTDPENPSGTVQPSLSLTSYAAGYNANSGWVVIKASGSWSLGIEEDIDWARVSQTEGYGNKSTVSMSWDRNTGRKDRSCTVCLAVRSDTLRAIFTQYGTDSDIVPDKVQAYMELPEIKDSTLYFFSHPMEMDSKVTRNFSYLYDKDAFVARWVAYPLNNRLRSGSCGRSENWGDCDPKFPARFQPSLSRAYSGNGSWARGHQIPSADRQIKAYNEQTFYGVNMTPQNQSFNSGVWGSLENYVRTCSGYFDTLYVVTGCLLGTSSTYDNNGNKVNIPSKYYKALLGYSRDGTVGKSASSGGYIAVGFLFDNRSYSGGYWSKSMTVRELESQTGENFFVNLEKKLSPKVYDQVETTIDNWWNR